MRAQSGPHLPPVPVHPPPPPLRPTRQDKLLPPPSWAATAATKPCRRSGLSTQCRWSRRSPSTTPPRRPPTGDPRRPPTTPPRRPPTGDQCPTNVPSTTSGPSTVPSEPVWCAPNPATPVPLRAGVVHSKSGHRGTTPSPATPAPYSTCWPRLTAPIVLKKFKKFKL
jgi:hypothetical protein